MQFSSHTDSSGNLFGVHVPESNLAARVHIPTALAASPAFSKPVENLGTAINSFTKSAPDKIERLSPKGWAEKVQDELSDVSAAVVALQRKGIEHVAYLASKRAQQLKPASPLPAERLTEIRQWARLQKPHNLVAVAVRTPAVAEAILDFPLLLDLPADLVVHIEDAFVIHNITQMYLSQTPATPTVDNPLASGADFKDAEKMGAGALKIYEAAAAEIPMVKSVIQHTVEFYALAAGLKPAEAFKAMGLA